MKRDVLLIDDERSFRVIVAAALESEGYRVRAMGTLREAREAWNEAPSDLVILDRNLPDGDGVELLEALRKDAGERNLDTTFLMVTAYADVDHAVLALKRGADDYVTKPIQLPDLLVKLRKALERRALERRVHAMQRAVPDVVTTLRRTRSAAMQRVLEMAERVAEARDTHVLIQGESGTGKDMIARYVHTLTPRRSEGAFVELNCAAISEQLAESELFGHERGAFTDAKTAKRGLLELADEGTIFLDEIGDLPLGMQGTLLRVLETMRFRRVGGTIDREVDVRVISATNRDLAKSVAEKTFRLDLFHRLDVFHLVVPPLRERPEDLVPLAEQLVADASRRLGRAIDSIDPDAQRRLRAYPFPGNVRELRNVVERAVILEKGTSLRSSSILLGRASDPTEDEAFAAFQLDESGNPPSLRDVERVYVERVLRLAQGNKSQAARLLGVSYPTIVKKMRDYGLE